MTEVFESEVFWCEKYSQVALFAIVLAILVVTALLSAYVPKIDKGRLACARLNQRFETQLYWDGKGCVMYDDPEKP